ncbi:TRAP transporter small permease [Noviherbaspirillum sp.]|uniref:TRAP transporter small permease subunit n=1 Tax=Noviherbaspirillum sp. TaxID=1926288 RepID=UPI002B46DD1F|nr:TRAP transporter small permease [Noviherbaspirillum sp.]HJV80252.1 TRAP transporter small permease [Noviherbaspirillum sp.]
MERLNNAVERLSLACAYVAAGLLLASILIVTWMVIYRTSGHQNSWELETSIMMMVGAAFLGSPYTLRTKGHVGMELLDTVLSDRSRMKLALLGHAVGFVVCVYLAWLGLHMTIDAFLANERTLGLWTAPEWPKYAAMPIGMGLTALQYLVEMQKSLHPQAR